MSTDVDRGLDELLADTTCQPGNHKCFPAKELKASSGFVSNWNNSMMRCRLWCILSVLVHCSGLAWSSRLSGIQISKLNRRSGPDEDQPDNRKFNEPSATRRTQFYWCRWADRNVFSWKYEARSLVLFFYFHDEITFLGDSNLLIW